ncbi:MAG TPA: PAS domain-containing sensor histidine kinase [Sphingomonadaceae bacterium]|nr:PAS domain-containing sensor histidine kinase [Sphingomonadaceae bacterium]
MTAAQDLTVSGRVDASGALVAADDRLARLNARAGGRIGSPVAVAQIADIVRLARRLRITVSRSAVASDGEGQLDIWVRAEPDGKEIALTVTGWQRRPRVGLSRAEPTARALRVDPGADWHWETDDALRLTGLSPAAISAVGGDTRPLIGAPLTRLFSFIEDADGDLRVLTALAEHRRFDGQQAALRDGGGERYRLTGLPMKDGHGRFAGFRGTAARIDEDAEVPPAPDMPDGSAFSERLDEALRSPLDRIIANAEDLQAQSEGPLRSEYAAYATDIAAAGRHLLSLVDDLVDLQAIERPDFRPAREELDLADVARRAAGLLSVRAASGNVRIDRPEETDSMRATGEFRRTLQILVNLIGNAVRYSPPGGMVWVRTEREGDLAAIVVADQGKGIAPEDQARIFHKFERVDPAEPGGTGLGLYIARRLARAMGGDIAVDSAPGQGARFTLTLPAR